MKLTDEKILELSIENGVAYKFECGRYESPYVEGTPIGDYILDFARAILKEAGVEELERDAPRDAISRVLTEVMDAAVQNGADSRSMPDDYVAIAAWLCGVREPEQTPVAYLTKDNRQLIFADRAAEFSTLADLRPLYTK